MGGNGRQDFSRRKISNSFAMRDRSCSIVSKSTLPVHEAYACNSSYSNSSSISFSMSLIPHRLSVLFLLRQAPSIVIRGSHTVGKFLRRPDIRSGMQLFLLVHRYALTLPTAVCFQLLPLQRELLG